MSKNEELNHILLEHLAYLMESKVNGITFGHKNIADIGKDIIKSGYIKRPSVDQLSNIISDIEWGCDEQITMKGKIIQQLFIQDCRKIARIIYDSLGKEV